MRNKYALFWMWMFLLPLALDFKGAESSSKVLQILLVVPTVAGGIALMLIAPRFARRSRLRSFVTAARSSCRATTWATICASSCRFS
jgi:FtsH-binding integral membrane protein